MIDAVVELSKNKLVHMNNLLLPIPYSCNCSLIQNFQIIQDFLGSYPLKYTDQSITNDDR